MRPLRRLPERGLRVETEFSLRGYTDKRWLMDRECHFWDHWHNPRSQNHDDLGPVYGFQWRHFGATYTWNKTPVVGHDQLKAVLKELKNVPESKRLLVTAWNPSQVPEQAIPPCPFAFQLLTYDATLNLVFYQRSVDVCIGLPIDFAQHALLLHLFCQETGYREGRIVGLFGQAELYETHVDGAKEMCERVGHDLPSVATSSFTNLFDWSWNDTRFLNYQAHEKIRFSVAV